MPFLTELEFVSALTTQISPRWGCGMEYFLLALQRLCAFALKIICLCHPWTTYVQCGLLKRGHGKHHIPDSARSHRERHPPGSRAEGFIGHRPGAALRRGNPRAQPGG